MPPANLIPPSPKKATRLSWALGVGDWIQFLYGLLGGGAGVTDILNGGFQVYTGMDGIPDNWNFTAYRGGSGAIDTTTTPFGTQSFNMVIPANFGAGNGAGYLDSYASGGEGVLVPCNPAMDFYATWWSKTTNPTSNNLVEVLWYTSMGVYISATTLWQSNAGQPSVWTQYNGYVAASNIPTNAYFYSIRLYGAMPTTSYGGHVWYGQIKSWQAEQEPASDLNTTASVPVTYSISANAKYYADLLLTGSYPTHSVTLNLPLIGNGKRISFTRVSSVLVTAHTQFVAAGSDTWASGSAPTLGNGKTMTLLGLNGVWYVVGN